MGHFPRIEGFHNVVIVGTGTDSERTNNCSAHAVYLTVLTEFPYNIPSRELLLPSLSPATSAMLVTVKEDNIHAVLLVQRFRIGGKGCGQGKVRNTPTLG